MHRARGVNVQLVIAALIAVASFGSAWQIQDWRFTSKEADRDRQTYETSLESQRLAHRAQTQDDKRVIDAQNSAALRQRVLRADADSSRAALVSVSHAAGEALSRALQSHDACLATANAASELLITVSTERRELSEKADGHVSDLKTLIQAWPRCRAE